MRSAALFLAGILVGSGMQAVAQPGRAPLALNHVAISVPDLDEGIKYYAKALGLKEAFTFRDDRGLEVSDLRKAIVQFRRDGLRVDDPVESARTHALISQAAGLNELRFELLEFSPNSLQRKVMNAWK